MFLSCVRAWPDFQKKKKVVFFPVSKSHRSNFLHFHVFWDFMKVQNKEQPKQFLLCLVFFHQAFFFFSFPCFLATLLVKRVHHAAGKTRTAQFVWLLSYVGERESGQCVSSFLKVWVKEVHSARLFTRLCFQCWEHRFWWLQRCMWSQLAPNPAIPLKRWSDGDSCDLMVIPPLL